MYRRNGIIYSREALHTVKIWLSVCPRNCAFLLSSPFMEGKIEIYFFCFMTKLHQIKCKYSETIISLIKITFLRIVIDVYRILVGKINMN